ncbi:MAG TPA: hypothetical protein VGI48_00750 [Caldimonas sp.]|jgi:ElaB/YqjD/DUF883 family membrane-anchored ribosome-binding protein
MTAVQKLREQADAVVQRIQPQIAAVSTYARNEPTKALLISAATGAALMGLITLLVRAGGRSPSPVATPSLVASALAAIRDAALELADSAQSMAANAIDSTQKRATSALDSAQQRAAAALGSTQKRAAAAVDSTRERASAAADSVSESVADAWQKVRDQAAPVVDKVRPQVEAAAAYVKEDPTRAALGLAAAGAIIAGLVALARQAQSDD